MKSKAIIVAILLSIMLVVPVVYASGGGGGSFRPATNDPYNLGKSIYAGQYRIKAEVDENLAEKQIKKLEWLQGQLPPDQQKVVYLPEFAGRLTESQLNALEVFISKRFKVDTSKFNE